MSRRPLDDPYQAVIRCFNQRGVRYVVVGMSGINYYATKATETFATLDYDIFIEPTLNNVEHAIRNVGHLGFTIGTAAGPFQREDLRAIVREKRTIIATTPDGWMVELLLAVSGFPFAELAKDAATFTVKGVPVHVGRLTKLLQSKKLAGRPKDRAFLQRYRSILEER